MESDLPPHQPLNSHKDNASLNCHYIKLGKIYMETECTVEGLRTTPLDWIIVKALYHFVTNSSKTEKIIAAIWQ